MISNVSQGLIQLRGDFGECVAFVEMQAESITLVFGKSVEKSLDGRISDQFVSRLVPFGSIRPRIDCFRCFIEIDLGVEVARLESAAFVESAVIGHLDDPGANSSLGRIKDRAVAMDEEKHILQQVIRLGIVAQNTHRYGPYQTGIAAEEDGQGFPAPGTDLSHQGFVRD